MITARQISGYQGPVLARGGNILIIPALRLLSPYIANYTVTCPVGMDSGQSVLPTASTTLVYAVGDEQIVGGLRGVNTVPSQFGAYAAQFSLLVLVEFHPAGLFPFIRVNQRELLDHSMLFAELSGRIDREIIEAILATDTIGELSAALDRIFLSHLQADAVSGSLAQAMYEIVSHRGMITGKELTARVCYSERHLNRLFHLHIGTGVKTFSRIVRMKYAADLLDRAAVPISALYEQTGHYDQAHFIHDFKQIIGMTPGDYKLKQSVYYNDPFKINTDIQAFVRFLQ